MTDKQKKDFISAWFETMMQFHHHDHLVDDADDKCDEVAYEFHTLQAEQYRNQLIGMERCLQIIGYKISVIDGQPTIVEKV